MSEPALTENGFLSIAEASRSKLEFVAAMMISDWDEAKNIVQEAITLGLRARDKLEHANVVYPWLRTTAVNLSKRYLSRQANRAKSLDPSEMHEVFKNRDGEISPGPLSELLKEETSTKLWLCLNQLPEAFREVIVLYYIEGMTYEEIEQATGIASATLRARAMRGRNLLKFQLGSVVDTWMRGDSRCES
jgi:RNA polymerase sigma-70 factor, ECF subfamily